MLVFFLLKYELRAEDLTGKLLGLLSVSEKVHLKGRYIKFSKFNHRHVLKNEAYMQNLRDFTAPFIIRGDVKKLYF